MSYRTIAVHVNASRHSQGRTTLAARIAVENDAHLVGVASTGLPPAMYLEGTFPNGSQMLETYMSIMSGQAERALEDFERIANQYGVGSFEKRLIDDETGEALCLQGRYSDLVVAGQPDKEEVITGERGDVLEYALINSGRPLLVVPHALKDTDIGDRAVIAWDGSLAASRAIVGAIPLLRGRQRIQILTFNQEGFLRTQDEAPNADIASYLARHDVTVEMARQQIAAGIDIADALLSHALDFGAGLIVMGGYGHSRLREIVLGGTTRGVLQSMPVPVLFSH